MVSFHEPIGKHPELPSINLPVATPRPSVTVLPLTDETFPVLKNAVRKKLSGGKYRAKPFLRYRNRTKTPRRIIFDLFCSTRSSRRHEQGDVRKLMLVYRLAIHFSMNLGRGDYANIKNEFDLSQKKKRELYEAI